MRSKSRSNKASAVRTSSALLLSCDASHASVGTGHGARRFQEVRNKRIYKPSNKRTTQEKSSGTGHKQVVVAVVLLFSCAVHPTSALLAWCYLLAKAQAIASCALHQDARESFT